MSSFLFAAENVAQQRQNMRHDLKKLEEESRTVELALVGHNCCLFLVNVAQKKKSFCYSNVFKFFGTIVALLSLGYDNEVS